MNFMNVRSVDKRPATVDSVNELVRKIEGRFTEHARHLNELRKFEGEIRMDQQLRAQQDLNDKLMAHSQSYANVVIGVGYAGFFALWNVIEKSMPSWAHATAGLLIGVSLAVFVAWEVVKMIWSALHLRSVRDNLKNDKGTLTICELVAVHERHERRAFGPWIVALVATVGPAAISAGLILWFLAKQLFSRLA